MAATETTSTVDRGIVVNIDGGAVVLHPPDDLARQLRECAARGLEHLREQATAEK